MTVHPDESIALEVRQKAQATDRSQAETTRETFESHAERDPRPAPKGIGAYSSGRSDVSASAEEILRPALGGRT